MSVIKYFIERWITYTFIILVFIFSNVIYKLDKNLYITESNANYILSGWVLLFIIFVVLDYNIFNYRVNNFKNYANLNASSKDWEDFIYPLDKEYGQLVENLVGELEKFKTEISTKTSEEVEFITKWVHDVKVPISASRLILENYEGEMPYSFYQSMDKELFSIEQSVQRIFYEIKSNSFYEDYKIARVSTNKLIANTLKGYSNFFSYKKININIDGGTYDVLTDEKWSGYILSQIISNAVKYTPIQGTIIITTTKNENKVNIAIKNSGIGIMKKDIGQIFNKGYTSSENRIGMKATGYGLYLSKKMSNILGHELTVDSNYGEYAIFNLTFIENKTIHNVTKM